MEGVVDDVEYSSAIGGVELYFDGYLEVNVELEVADEAVGTCITSKGCLRFILRSEVGVLDKNILILEHPEPAKIVGVLV